MAKKTGKLSNVEKMAIQGGISQDLTVDEIANQLDRRVSTVDNYITRELSTLLETVINARVASGDEPPQEETNKKSRRYSTPKEGDIQKTRPDKVEIEEIADLKAINETVKRLINAGLLDRDANKVVRKVLEAAGESGVRYGDNVDLLYAHAIGKMNAGQFMVKRTAGGNEGVAMMTSGASGRLDDALKRAPKAVSRSARGNVWNPKTGEYM